MHLGGGPADGGQTTGRRGVDPNFAIAGGLGAVVLLSIFGFFSLGSVPPLTYGILYNRWHKTADLENVYSSGRHLIGPWNTFVLFPSAVQTVEFTNEPALLQSGVRYPKLHTRTKDGLALYLQVSLQFRLIKEKVGSLYSEFNVDYEQMFISAIRDILIKAAADYEAFQFWEQRQDVGVRMQSMVQQALTRTYADCWGLQLMVIELPQGFEDSIGKTQVWEQRVQTREFEQDATRIRAETAVIEAEFAKQVKVIKANGLANYTYITKAAAAEARKNTLNIEAKVLKSVKDKLTLNEEELIAYQRFAAIKSLENASVYFGFNSGNAKVLLPSPSPPTVVGMAGRHLREEVVDPLDTITVAPLADLKADLESDLLQVAHTSEMEL